MAKWMKVITAVVTGCTILLTVCYLATDLGLFLSTAITFGTFSYHLLMRLAVGWVINGIMHNQANHNHPWFRLRPFEKTIVPAFKNQKMEK